MTKKSKVLFIQTTDICRKCGVRFPLADPCPHIEELRQENMAHFEEQLAMIETPEELETKMWKIAERLWRMQGGKIK